MPYLPVQMPMSPGRRYVPLGETHVGIASLDKKTAPSPFKLYRSCEQIALDYEILKTAPVETDHTFSDTRLGQMLADIYGLTRRLRHTSDALPPSDSPDSLPAEHTQHQLGDLLRRPVPSGGGLFPCELYLFINQHLCLPAGIYHYDVVHHALDILRQGNYASYLDHALSSSQDKPPSPFTFALLLTCFFWKDGCKYQDFSYRLQSLDLGVVIAQSLTIMDSYTLPAIVHYQFLDQSINALLGLNFLSESVYAVITFGSSEASERIAENHSPAHLDPPSAHSDTLPLINRWPLLAELHTSSLILTPNAFLPQRSLPALESPVSGQSYVLPVVPLDLLAHARPRHSAWGYFKAESLTQHQLATLLIAGAQGYNCDLDGSSAHLQQTLLYCVVNRIEGLSSGVYSYHPRKHSLELLRAADLRAELQSTLKNFRYNMFHVSVCIFPIAKYERGFDIYGDRWYRIQNMEAGICLQRIHLAASSLNLGSQINLGYHVQRTNELLHLPEYFTSLAQIMVAPEYAAGQYYEQLL